MLPIPPLQMQLHDVNINCCNNDTCPNCCTKSPLTPENIPATSPHELINHTASMPDLRNSPRAHHLKKKVHDSALPVILPSSPEFSPRSRHVRFQYDEERKEVPERPRKPDITKEKKNKNCCVIM